MARNEQWLKHELMKALGWDDFVVEGVVDVISKAKSSDEVQDIVNVCLMPYLGLRGCTWPSASAASADQQQLPLLCNHAQQLTISTCISALVHAYSNYHMLPNMLPIAKNCLLDCLLPPGFHGGQPCGYCNYCRLYGSKKRTKAAATAR